MASFNLSFLGNASYRYTQNTVLQQVRHPKASSVVSLGNKSDIHVCQFFMLLWSTNCLFMHNFIGWSRFYPFMWYLIALHQDSFKPNLKWLGGYHISHSIISVILVQYSITPLCIGYRCIGRLLNLHRAHLLSLHRAHLCFHCVNSCEWARPGAMFRAWSVHSSWAVHLCVMCLASTHDAALQLQAWQATPMITMQGRYKKCRCTFPVCKYHMSVLVSVTKQKLL